MFLNDVLHDMVVAMSVDSDVRGVRNAKVHDTTEYAVYEWVAGYSVDDMIWLGGVKPLAFVDCRVGRFGLRKAK